MIKKIAITLILFSILFACGKKGDPVFKESKETIETQKIQSKKV